VYTNTFHVAKAYVKENVQIQIQSIASKFQSPPAILQYNK